MAGHLRPVGPAILAVLWCFGFHPYSSPKAPDPLTITATCVLFHARAEDSVILGQIVSDLAISGKRYGDAIWARYHIDGRATGGIYSDLRDNGKMPETGNLRKDRVVLPGYWVSGNHCAAGKPEPMTAPFPAMHDSTIHA
ncbi:hypothetical protein An03g01150 [Aspergillus niger]|uniref:Uncharacterized protein n=2 Tax=Aspergillus niger TaxID=5061 RepID=A2QFX8_ASPNC|nr:hypothetical protein An03g01150 [Aspergillus niger]CAK38088.1 hypothetical protein An03g01150 [Aspergillus niger]